MLTSAPDASAWRCATCRQDYPEIEGVPCLVPQPLHYLQEWRQRYLLLSKREEQIERQLRERLQDPGLARGAWARLAKLADGHALHRRALQQLLAPLQLPSATSAATLEGVQTQLPLSQDLTSYYVNLHRDWVWGDEENRAALSIVTELAAGQPLGCVLIPGAGAGRLAYDLHQSAAHEATVALDINPLLAWGFSKIAAGEELSLVEFPIAPRTVDDVAPLRQLRAPAPARNGLTVLLADLVHLPFAPASFDTVVTPWLIDILPERLARVAERIARVLRPGGRWINFGSVAFAAADPAEQLLAAELGPQIASYGLTIERQRDDIVPYMRSPASRHSRLEETYAFVARRNSQPVDAAPLETPPAWIQNPRLPVPVSPFLAEQALKQQVYGFVAALVDGRRSIADIAAHLAEKRLMTPAEALPAVRSFLMQLHEQSRQRRQWSM